MLRLLSTAVLCVGLMSGCATTEKLMDKVHIGSSDSATPLQQVLNIHPDLKKASSNWMCVRCLTVQNRLQRHK